MGAKLLRNLERGASAVVISVGRNGIAGVAVHAEDLLAFRRVDDVDERLLHRGDELRIVNVRVRLGDGNGVVVDARRHADLDTSILESLDASGCTAFQKIRYGIIPQLTPNIISTVIYRFDINIKDATTLGIVGAGGIGAALIQCINSRRWTMVGSFILAMIVLMLVIEFASTKIRGKLARGQ